MSNISAIVEWRMDLGIQDLRVIVTAGANGIGLEVARSSIREGARVHICDIDESALKSLEQTDPEITRSFANVAKRTDVERLFVEALQSFGGLDVLVKNAGIAGPTGRVDEIAPEEWDRTLEVKITSQF
jgi:NAD(P)-dependent dehydrogenase (short-subunit alcohol dehydrogenase family)